MLAPWEPPELPPGIAVGSLLPLLPREEPVEGIPMLPEEPDELDEPGKPDEPEEEDCDPPDGMLEELPPELPELPPELPELPPLEEGAPGGEGMLDEDCC